MKSVWMGFFKDKGSTVYATMKCRKTIVGLKAFFNLKFLLTLTRNCQKRKQYPQTHKTDHLNYMKNSRGNEDNLTRGSTMIFSFISLIKKSFEEQGC